MNNSNYIAHLKVNEDSDNGDVIVQSMTDHINGTKNYARIFGEKFKLGKEAGICAIYHDIGKYSTAFQRRIRGANIRVDHSTAGAQEVKRRYGLSLAYCIAGHHGGLPDGGNSVDSKDSPNLFGRLKREVEPYSDFFSDYTDYEDVQKEKIFFNDPLYTKKYFIKSFMIRMVFSCLVDADYLDTESFMIGEARQSKKNINDLCEKSVDFVKAKSNNNSELNIIRNEIFQKCINKAENPPGLFSLTVPTGGGKTLSSLCFALEHAKKNGLDRVIYVIPYNSIIEQNAAVFKDVLGFENVLEHHSNYVFDQTDENIDTKIYNLHKKASENWDIPIIVTTTVQFFESIYSNKPSSCRKLHNIANSVIIFDEAQMLPIPYLKPCVRAIGELVLRCNSTAVLCSATQPSLDKFFHDLPLNEICSGYEQYYEKLVRAKIQYIANSSVDEFGNITLYNPLTDEDLVDRLSKERQVLCIVGTRKQAQNLYDLLSIKVEAEVEEYYHLSTLMTPFHRKKILKEIKEKLIQNKNCKVISTSLIEAGVDIDFPTVYRAIAGLDSIIQAAGRCNREGKRDPQSSIVYVYEPEEKYTKSYPYTLQTQASYTRDILLKFKDDSVSPSTIKLYFDKLYKNLDMRGDSLDTKKIVSSLADPYERYPFKTVAEKFHLIENETRSVIIATSDESLKLISELRLGSPNRDLLRKLQQHTVNVYNFEFDKLLSNGAIEFIHDYFALLKNNELYSENTGLQVNQIDTSAKGFFV